MKQFTILLVLTIFILLSKQSNGQSTFPFQGTFCNDSVNYIVGCYTFKDSTIIDTYVSDTYCFKRVGTFSYKKLTENNYQINIHYTSSYNKGVIDKNETLEIYVVNKDYFKITKVIKSPLNEFRRSKYLCNTHWVKP